MIICVLIGTMVFAIGCTDETETEEFEFLKIEEMPANLDDYAGTIEWIDSNAKTTTFESNKSTIILIGGYATYDTKYEFGLDEEIYVYDSSTSSGGLASNADQYFLVNGTMQLSSYWSKLGYNVGIFHYECFADDSLDAVNDKIYNSSAMTYIDKDGNEITSEDKLPEFNLTELLVARWLEIAAEYSLSSAVSNSKPMEVRFVGTSVGSNLAVSATEYLNKMYDAGNLDADYLPTRVTLTNPYLSNSEFTIEETGSDTTALAEMESSIDYLAYYGTVFELIESDEEFFFSYEESYSGVVSEDVVDDDDVVTTEYTLSDEGDAGLYNSIKSNVAYLAFSEMYSESYTDEYAAMDRASLDWYLYSVVGSDDPNITTTSNLGYFNSKPMLDDRNGGGSQSVSRYSISAWTPTVYTRAQRGIEYTMLNRTYTSGVYVYNDYTLGKLATENYQVSNFEGIQVVGYVYLKYANSDAINFGRDSIFADFKVKVTIYLSKTEIYLYGTTDAAGYYSILIPEAYYGETTTIEFVTPNKNYGLASSLTNDLQDYMYMSMNGYVSSDTSVTISLSSANYLVTVVNCAFVDLT